MVPYVERGIDGGEALAGLRLRGDRRVVDERVELVVIEPPLDLCDRLARALGIGKIDLDVVLGSHLPWAVFWKRVARAGNHAPAGGGEALDGRMPNAAARSGKKERAALLIGRGHVLEAFSRYG